MRLTIWRDWRRIMKIIIRNMLLASCVVTVIGLSFYAIRSKSISRAHSPEDLHKSQDSSLTNADQKITTLNENNAPLSSHRVEEATVSEMRTIPNHIQFDDVYGLLRYWEEHGYPDYYSGYDQGYMGLSQNTETIRQEILSHLKKSDKIKFIDSRFSQNERESVMRDLSNRLPELLGEHDKYIYWLGARLEYHSALASKEWMQHRLEHGISSNPPKPSPPPKGEYEWGIVIGIDSRYIDEITAVLKATYGDYIMLTSEALPWDEGLLIVEEMPTSSNEP